MKNQSRRQFMKSGSAAAASAMATACATAPWSKVVGANEKMGLGIIGCGGRGNGVGSVFNKSGRVEVLGVCDVFDERRAGVKTGYTPNAKEYGAHEDLLADDAIDAVYIATPDHWHARIAIDALNAGKHVYVEKPLTYSVEEGIGIVKAARLNDRVCQVGMQQRSGEHYRAAKERIIDSGMIGKVTLARTWWHGNGAHLRPAPEGPKPEGLDWKRFVGPRPWRDWDPEQYFNFRAYLDFGGGQITDLYTHWIDVVQMLLGEERPLAAVASGGVYNYKDGRNAPDTICVLTEFPGGWTSTFEATLAPGLGGDGIEIVGTEGRLLFEGRRGWKFFPLRGKGEPIEMARVRDLDEAHVENFLDCCATGERPNGDVAIGHRAAMTSHLGNLAYLGKRRIELDSLDDRILPI